MNKNLLSEVQFYDKYSRYNYETGTREDWPETVKRVTDYLFSFDKNNVLTEYERDEIFTAILNQDVMPSMRNLASSGAAASRNNIASYNCSAVVIDNTYAFYEAVIILMNGSGLGYSVESRFTDKLPLVCQQYPYSNVNIFIVPDTTEGWADAIYTGITTWLSGKDILFNYSNVRPAGTPLKIKGGRASGSDVLKESLKNIRNVILSRQGNNLRPLDVHDIMCHIAKCIVSGGSRRSAMIAIFDFDDSEMLSCKDAGNIEGNEQRYLSNNSAAVQEFLSYSELEKFMNRMFDSYSGEPGIFSRYAIKKTLPVRRKYSDDLLPNPCQPGFAKILTPEGIRNFDDIKIGSIVWSQDGWVRVANKVATGVKPVFEYLTTGGRFIGTDNHRVVTYGEKVEVRYADSIDILGGEQNSKNIKHNLQIIVDGLVLGDGSVHMASKNKIYLTVGENDKDYFDSEISNYIGEPHAVKYGSAWNVKTDIQIDELPHTYNRIIPDRYFYGDSITVASFLRGLYSANGSIVDGRITLKTTSYQMLLQVQDMLSSIGIRSYYTTNKPTIVEHSNGMYESKMSYDLNITSDRNVFKSRIGFLQEYKNNKLNNACEIKSKNLVKNHSIVNSTYIGDFDVYDITVDGDSHTYWTSGVNVSNCSEIILRGSGQFCNLSSVVARPDDTLATLKHKVKIAAIIGTIQAMSQHFPGLRSIWTENQEEERLLGVDLNNVMDVALIRNSRVLEILKTTAVDTNQEYAIRLGIKPATAVTCIKPSGNSSVLLNTASGIHPRWSDFYIRRIQLHEANPILGILQMYGVPTERSNHLENTWVASFPVKAPEGAITNGTFNAVQQLDNWRLFKETWAEHSVSCTIAYKESERQQIIDWLYENQGIISGLSFLPKDEHTYAQAPYEKITSEQYYQLMKNFPKEIDWSILHELERGLGDTTNGSQLSACSSDKCEVTF